MKKAIAIVLVIAAVFAVHKFVEAKTAELRAVKTINELKKTYQEKLIKETVLEETIIHENFIK